MIAFAEIQAALKKISKWPWGQAAGNFVVCNFINNDPSTGLIVAEIPCQGENRDRDFAFIAKSPEYVSWLLDRLIEAEAEVARLDFDFSHKDVLVGIGSSICDSCFRYRDGNIDPRHNYTPAGWKAAAEKRLREDR